MHRLPQLSFLTLSQYNYTQNNMPAHLEYTQG